MVSGPCHKGKTPSYGIVPGCQYGSRGSGVAFAISLPIALVAHVSYGALVLLPCLQLAVAVALRWSLGVAGWFALLLTAAAVWFVGMASVFALHWTATVYVVLLLGIVAGLVAVVWQPPRNRWIVSR
jgi:hypothetical protein